MRRAGRVWIRIFPDVPVSKKPTEVRMGKGKARRNSGVPGRARTHHVRARRGAGRCCPRSASPCRAKLPIKTRFIERIVE